jgi:hypothetical protein
MLSFTSPFLETQPKETKSMPFRRLFMLAALFFVACGSAYAQQPGPQFWRRLSCEPFEGRNKLEALELKYETLLIKGFTRITTVEISGIRIDAVDVRDTRAGGRAMGVIVSLREAGERPREARALIDYDELDPLLKAIDAASKVGEAETRLVGFEARYKTIGDMELVVFRQTRTGIAVTLTVGLCDKITESMTLDELAKFRAMIVEAKTRLDEIK